MNNKAFNPKDFEKKPARPLKLNASDSFTVDLAHPALPKKTYNEGTPWATPNSSGDHIQFAADLNTQEWISLNIPTVKIPTSDGNTSLRIVPLSEYDGDKERATMAGSLHNGSRLRFWSDFNGDVTLTRVGKKLTLRYQASNNEGFEFSNGQFIFNDD